MKTFILGAPSKLNNYAQEGTDKLFSKVGNTGNFAFRYSIKKQLLPEVKEVSWGRSLDDIKHSGDIAVLPCANMLGEHTDLGNRYEVLKKTNCKLLAIGLGGQSSNFEDFPNLPKGTLNFLDLLCERSQGKKNITVRGAYTKSLLSKYGYTDNVEVLGCPSLFLNPIPNLGNKINSKFKSFSKIGVAAGNPAVKEFWEVEKQLYRLSVKNNGSYIVQHPLPFLKFSRNEISSINDQWKNNIASATGLLDNIEIKNLYLPNNVESFYDIQSWMECLRRHDFIVGARIHGVLLAMQAGVPAMCIVHDSRTQELCDTMKVPSVNIKKLLGQKISRDLLLDHYNFDPVVFDENRKELASKYFNLLLENNISVSDHLKSLL